MDHDRHCAEIRTQAELLATGIARADLATPVPSCPGWTVNQLVRHVGGAHGWVAEMVRTGATSPPPDDHFRDLSPYTGEDPAELGAWLVDGAADLAAVLRAAGPDAAVWTPLPSLGARAAFHARRMAHETVVHRADAILALGDPFVLDTEVAVDAFDEWMTLGSVPEMLEFHPLRRELLGPGRTLAFAATDADAGWVVDLTGDELAWRPGREPAAVTVHGPVTDLLLVLYGRAGPGCVRVEGDAELLDFWLARVAFG